MKYLRAIVAAALAFLAYLTAIRIATEKAKAEAWHEGDERDVLDDIQRGTYDARARAERAKAHLDKAGAARAKLNHHTDKLADLHEELDNGFDRFRSRARRGMRNDP